MDPSHIRNFSVIAHIDHGKSTLADRFLEITGALQAREMEAQVLDAMDLERERGITIKAHPVRLNYTLDGRRRLRPQPDRHAGARRLLVRSHPIARRVRGRAAAGGRVAGRRGADAGQRLPGGREQPRDHPGHQQDRSAWRAARGGPPSDYRTSSASTAATRFWPARSRAPACRRSSKRSSSGCRRPAAIPDAPLKALIFDSWYDPYRGVVIVVRVIDGVDPHGHEASASWPRGRTTTPSRSGIFTPKAVPVDELGVGEVGFLVANIKKISDAKIGDTITEAARPTAEAVPRLQGAEADGVRRSLPGRRARVRRAARRAREAAAERRVVLLRAGDLGRARLRLPLRVPRAAAHGDRPGAARARVRHGPGHDRARACCTA